MAPIPKAVAERIAKGLKTYQKILSSAAARDINESDTVRIIADMLADVLGFDRYSEVTTEYCVRGTYCDLAVKDGDKVHFLIEAKAIGVDLKENHLRQAMGYASNEGVEWVILTNGAIWQVYRIGFSKPVTCDLLFQANLLLENQRIQSLLDEFYLLSREGIKKAAIAQFSEERQLMNKYTLAALLVSPSVLDSIRKELRKLNGSVKLDPERLSEVLRGEVLKREVVEGEKATEAAALLKKMNKKQSRAGRSSAGSDQPLSATPEGTAGE